MLGRKKVARIGIAVAALALGLAACTGTPTQGGSAKGGNAKAPLVVEFQGPPLSMNPAFGSTQWSLIFTMPDYDPLIYLTFHGKKYEPDLATSWGYVGKGNTAFEMTLRKGVKFQDGSPLTAQAVKNSLLYFKAQGGPEASQLATVKSIDVTGKYTLVVHFSTAEPSAPFIFSQADEAGFVIGPKGLANPSSLATQSDGAGQFVLHPSGVVPNVSYTFTKNPHYWNPGAVHFSNVEVKVIGPSPSSIFSAISTNQVQFSLGDKTTAASAKGAELKIYKSIFSTWNLLLNDRSGPLGNLKVRQAINYAIDRPALTSALLKTPVGTFGSPDDEPFAKGTEGYDPAMANYYPYNPTKAKQLLTEAGYPNGFTMKVVDSGILDVNGAIASAVQSELAKVGIHLDLTVVTASENQFHQEAASKQFAAQFFGSQPFDAYDAFAILSKPGSATNPFGVTAPGAQNYFAQGAAKANVNQQAALWRKATDQLVKNAWSAPLLTWDNLYYGQANLKNVQVSDQNVVPDPFAPTSQGGWYISK